MVRIVVHIYYLWFLQGQQARQKICHVLFKHLETYWSSFANGTLEPSLAVSTVIFLSDKGLLAVAGGEQCFR